MPGAEVKDISTHQERESGVSEYNELHSDV
jgi:hypothetical protein